MVLILLPHTGSWPVPLMRYAPRTAQLALHPLIRLAAAYPWHKQTAHSLWPAGKFNRHIDYWDSVKNQNYFSFEAFGHVLSQLGSLSHAPADLETPAYMVLRRRKDWEVRRCAASPHPFGAR